MQAKVAKNSNNIISQMNTIADFWVCNMSDGLTVKILVYQSLIMIEWAIRPISD